MNEPEGADPMNTAHQPGSEPLAIPEQIPNPAVQPAPLRRPDRPSIPHEPVKIPEKAPADQGVCDRFSEFMQTQERSPKAPGTPPFRVLREASLSAAPP